MKNQNLHSNKQRRDDFLSVKGETVFFLADCGYKNVVKTECKRENGDFSCLNTRRNQK